MFRYTLIITAVATTLSIADLSFAQASFQGVGDLPGGSTFSAVNAVSGDGASVVGISFTGSGAEAFRWKAGSMITLGMVEATAVSFDGSVAVGRVVSGVQQAARWVEGSGVQVLGSLFPGSSSVAFGVSADGELVVGHSTSLSPGPLCNPNAPPPWLTPQGFQWSASGGMVGLGFPIPGAGPQSYAFCISNDGTVIGGKANVDSDCANSMDSFAITWTNGAHQIIGATGMEGPGQVTDVSPDGTALVGFDFNGPFIIINGAPIASVGFTPLGVSTGGHKVVGSAIGGTQALIWESASGVRNLQDVLVNDFGLASELTGWTLTHAAGISDDGTVIAGRGIHNGNTEGWVAILPADSDGDGLLDDWEMLGVPYTDAFGHSQRYILDDDGDGSSDADPNHKDLFLEVDAMAGFAPPSLDDVVAAFANAPVPNPDLVNGVKLHLLVDELDVPHVAMWPNPSEATFNAVKLTDVSGTSLNGYFGTEAERNHSEAEGIREAKLKVYRYALIIDQAAADVLGRAHDIWANDFFVAKGEFTVGTSPQDLCASCDIDTWFRTTFMHEFGHCLGLQHGGNDEVHYKPNYVSIMNYLYKLPLNLGHQAWKLDYSRGGMNPLAEIAIDENVGFVDDSGYNNGRSTYYSEWGCNPTDVCATWSQNVIPARTYEIGTGGRDFNDDGVFQSEACTDLNFFGTTSSLPSGAATSTPCQTFTDFDDWANIIYELISASPFGGPTPPVELTKTQIQALLQTMPADCSADIAPGAGDGNVNVTDLLEVLAHWGPCQIGQPCTADISPHVVADHVVNVNDLLAVINAWGPCP